MGFFRSFFEYPVALVWPTSWGLTWGKDVSVASERLGNANSRRAIAVFDNSVGKSCVAATGESPAPLRAAGITGGGPQLSFLWPTGRKFGDNQREMCGTYGLA
jgi:hypothetical protein